MEKPPNTYIQLTGMVFQMAVIIGGMAWFGNYLDEGSAQPIYTVIFSLIGVGIALYIAIKEVIDISKRN